MVAAGGAGVATETSALRVVVLPAPSVAVAVTVNVPAVAKACIALSPVAVSPSPKLHLTEAALNASDADAWNGAATPAIALAGAVRSEITGGVPSHVNASTWYAPSALCMTVATASAP